MNSSVASNNVHILIASRSYWHSAQRTLSWSGKSTTYSFIRKIYSFGRKITINSNVLTTSIIIIVISIVAYAFCRWSLKQRRDNRLLLHEV